MLKKIIFFFFFLLSVLEPKGKTTGCREAKWHCGAISACKYWWSFQKFEIGYFVGVGFGFGFFFSFDWLALATEATKFG